MGDAAEVVGKAVDSVAQECSRVFWSERLRRVAAVPLSEDDGVHYGFGAGCVQNAHREVYARSPEAL